jgi:hypothetical protein
MPRHRHVSVQKGTESNFALEIGQNVKQQYLVLQGGDEEKILMRKGSVHRQKQKK